MVNLELYRVFDAVAKCGSLTKAAESLYLSQPAVSQSIKQLESQLGGRLFMRTPKGMELTEIGVIMARYAENAITLLNEAEGKFKEFKGLKISTLKIGASDTFCRYHLLKFIKQYYNKYNINIQILNRTTDEIIDLLKQRKIDIGFINMPVFEGDLNIIEPCIELNDIFVCNTEFMKKPIEAIPLKKMEDYPLLLLELTTNSRKSIISFTQSLGIDLHPDIELGSIDLIIEFAKKGMGIACLPKEYVEKELLNGELIEIETMPKLPVRGIGIATVKNTPISGSAKEFIDLVRSDSDI